MWTFKGRSAAALDFEQVIANCDFQLAREQLAELFRSDNEEANHRPEFLSGWKRFSANPCATTARRWLNDAPAYHSFLLGYFSDCCPGGRFRPQAGGAEGAR